jgi:hypothetical protein
MRIGLYDYEKKSPMAISLFRFGNPSPAQPPTLAAKIDNRLEAISIFYILSITDTVDVKPVPSIYYRDVKRYFREFENHPAIRWYRNLDRWDGYSVASYGTFLSCHVPFRLRYPAENDYIRSSAPDRFLDSVNSFCRDFRYESFYRAHQPFYKKVTQAIKDSVEQSHIIEDTWRFFGSNDLRSLTVYIDLLNNHGNNAIVSQNPVFKDQCRIQLAYLDIDSLQRTDASEIHFTVHENIVAHEASHVYLKGFMETYKSQLDSLKEIFLETPDLKKLKEEEWENEMDELLVRVCVAHILGVKYGEAAGEKEINVQSSNYKLARPLHEFVKDFLSHRDRYPTFRQYYPKLIEFLRQYHITEHSSN